MADDIDEQFEDDEILGEEDFEEDDGLAIPEVADEDEGEPEEEGLAFAEFPEEDFEEDEDLAEDFDDDDLADDLSDDDEADVLDDLLVVKPKAEPKVVSSRRGDDDDEDDEEDEDEDDVEASLDDILKERLVVGDDEDEDDEDEEYDDLDDRADIALRVLPKQPDEFVCQSCFLVKNRSQVADKDRMFCRDCV